MSRKKGDARLGRLRTLIRQAQKRCGGRAAEVRQAHIWLCEIARQLEPTVMPETGALPTGTAVRARVEAVLTAMTTAVAAGRIAAWLQEPVTHMATILHRLGVGLYHCYDVPGLPRTNNSLEQFNRRIKTGERRITGHKRADAFVVRVGGFAAYAIAARDDSEPALLQALGDVPAVQWQQQRAVLWATRERQTKMRRFRLHRAAYLAGLEARWTRLTEPP